MYYITFILYCKCISVQSALLPNVFFFLCRNYTKKPMSNLKEQAWTTVKHQSSRLTALWRILVMYVLLSSYLSVLTLLIAFLYQLVIVFPGKIQRCLSKEHLGTLFGQFWGPTSDTLYESRSYEEWCKCGCHSVLAIVFKFGESSMMFSYGMFILSLEKLQSGLWGRKDKMLLPSDHNSRIWSY